MNKTCVPVSCFLCIFYIHWHARIFFISHAERILCDFFSQNTWSLEPTAIPEEVDRVVVSSPAPPGALGAAADRTPPPGAGGPGASTKDKPANDRTSSRVAPVLLLRKGVSLPADDDDDGWGPLPFKTKEFVSCHLGM